MKFGTSYSIAGFKAAKGITQLDVVRNPKTNKLFLSGDGQTVGSVSHKVDLDQPLQIVEIVDQETAEVVPCLVNQGQDNVVKSL